MNIPTEIRRWVALGCVVVVLIFAGLALSVCNARRDAATARQEGKVASGTVKAGSAAVEAVDGQMKAQSDLEAQERTNQGNILNAPDAKTNAGETGNAGRAALCANERLRREHPTYCRN